MKKDLKYYLDLKYPYLVHEDDDGSVMVEFPDLKGCMSCGETIAEAIDAAQDAKQAWFETALEEGLHIPEPKEIEEFSGSFRLRIPKTLHRELALNAKREGVSMNQYCVFLLSKEAERKHCHA